MTGPATYARIADDLRSGSEPVQNKAFRKHRPEIIHALDLASEIDTIRDVASAAAKVHRDEGRTVLADRIEDALGESK